MEIFAAVDEKKSHGPRHARRKTLCGCAATWGGLRLLKNLFSPSVLTGRYAQAQAHAHDSRFREVNLFDHCFIRFKCYLCISSSVVGVVDGVGDFSSIDVL